MFFVLPATMRESESLVSCLQIEVLELTLRVDDGWHGQDSVLAVVDYRICGCVSDNGKISIEMSVTLGTDQLHRPKQVFQSSLHRWS